jgi:hypothetical protein
MLVRNASVGWTGALESQTSPGYPKTACFCFVVLTFYGVLIYQMSFWDKTEIISAVLGDFGFGVRK